MSALTSQSVMSQMAWTMGSPSVVLPFLAVALELPMLLAGALVSIRKLGNMTGDIFLADTIASQREKKRAVALCEVSLGACLLLAVIVATTGSKPIVAIAFVAAFFLIGLIEEVQGLMLVDFLSDHLTSKSRMWQHYLQLGFGGIGAIALTLVIHNVMQGRPAVERHIAVIAIATACFVIAGFLVLTVRELVAEKPGIQEQQVSAAGSLGAFVSNAKVMFQENWFRHYLMMRLPLVVVALSVPFFALIAAEAHHSSAKGLTALILSTAAGFIVAAPLWQLVNMRSNRAVMVAGTLMVAITGAVLIVLHFLKLDHNVHVHAVSLFVATVAVTGVGGARNLYFMDIAPKHQRVKAAAVVKSVSRLTAVVIGAALATVAHSQEVIWAVVFVTLVSGLAAIACARLATSRTNGGEPEQG